MDSYIESLIIDVENGEYDFAQEEDATDLLPVFRTGPT